MMRVSQCASVKVYNNFRLNVVKNHRFCEATQSNPMPSSPWIKPSSRPTEWVSFKAALHQTFSGVKTVLIS